jgi:hypothetical protein
MSLAITLVQSAAWPEVLHGPFALGSLSARREWDWALDPGAVVSLSTSRAAYSTNVGSSP